MTFRMFGKTRSPAQFGGTINLRNGVLLVSGPSNVDLFWAIGSKSSEAD